MPSERPQKYIQRSFFDNVDGDLSPDNYNDPALLQDIPFDKIYEAARKEASRKKGSITKPVG